MASDPACQGAVRRRIGAAAVLSVSLILAATLCAASARLFWIGDLATHFRAQYAALSLVCLIVLIWVRRPVFAALALGALLLNITTVSSAFGWAAREAVASPAPAHEADPVKLVSINVFYRNSQYERVVDFLREEQPDAAVLVEITPRWRRELRSLEGLYSHRYFSATPVQRVGPAVERGVLLLSRWPIERAEPIDFGRWAEPGLAATLNVRGRPLNVMGVHPCWPMGPSISAERNRQLAQIAAVARGIEGPLVVLGDLNITAFSPHFEGLLAHSGLRSAAEGAGWTPTWPTFLPPAGIQIDHALVSRDIAVLRFERGPPVGSDHWPIVVTLAPSTRTM